MFRNKYNIYLLICMLVCFLALIVQNQILYLTSYMMGMANYILSELKK